MDVLNCFFVANFIIRLVHCDHVNFEDGRNQSKSPQLEYKARIVGGKVSDLEKRGYHVYVNSPQTKKIGAICGGTIIDTKWILSASHCRRLNYTGTVRVCSLPVTPLSCIDVKNAHRYPATGEIFYLFDYMLFELEKELTYGRTVFPIGIERSPLAIVPGKYGTVAGFGRTSYVGNKASKVLLEVDLPIVNRSTPTPCTKNLNVNEFCIGSISDRSRNIGAGDSGGGFVVDGKLLGVVVRASTMNTIIASVPFIKNWICQITGL